MADSQSILARKHGRPHEVQTEHHNLEKGDLSDCKGGVVY